MSNEYDYSGLYNNNNGTPPQPQGTQPQAQPAAEPAAQAAQPAAAGAPQPPQQGGYPNVGSTGLNTANTAEGANPYTAPYTPPYTAPQQPQQPQAPYQAPRADGGYTSSFGGNGGNGGNGTTGGYSYASAPQQPPKKPKKKGSAKKVLLRVAAGVGVVALGFGGGFAGSVVAARAGYGSNQVVVQQVERSTSTDAIAQGSTGGTTLTLQEISAIVQPSVVAITTEQMTSSNTWFGGYYVQSGAGSGVIISQDGYILTCAHVVSGATSIKVQLNDDTEYEATVIGADESSDIAVIKVEATGLTPAVIGDSDALVVGEDAIAVGNPLGTLGGSVTNGIVSALNRDVTVQSKQMTLIQTNASISPGNSGGGLFNGNGELIGIVNAKSSYSDAEGIGFAIPINTAMSVAQELIDTGHVARPVMGVTVYTVSDASTAQQLGVSTPGVYITAVNDGSGAQAAGVQVGDRVIAIDDTAVTTSTDVTNYLQNMSIGDVVTLQVEREGKILTLEITLGESS